MLMADNEPFFYETELHYLESIIIGHYKCVSRQLFGHGDSDKSKVGSQI